MPVQKPLKFTPITCPDEVGITKKGWGKIKSPLDSFIFEVQAKINFAEGLWAWIRHITFAVVKSKGKQHARRQNDQTIDAPDCSMRAFRGAFYIGYLPAMDD